MNLFSATLKHGFPTPTLSEPLLLLAGKHKSWIFTFTICAARQPPGWATPASMPSNWRRSWVGRTFAWPCVTPIRGL